MNKGFFRVACASPRVKIADVESNVANIKELISRAHEQKADVAVFPEMCITAYTCADLFHNETLMTAADDGLRQIADMSRECPGLLIVVGLPVVKDATLYNCAAVVCEGSVVALVPKTYVPNYNEFYERRWWSPCPANLDKDATATIAGLGDIAFGNNIVVRHKGVGIGTEICEDLWAPVPPSCRLTMAGAEVMLNLSASDDLIGKYNYLLSLVKQQSARCLCAYAYASAGFGESSTDLVFDSKLLIAENGTLLAVNKRWTEGNQIVVADIDIEALRRDRMHFGTFHDCALNNVSGIRIIPTTSALTQTESFELLRTVDSHPFVPASDERLRERCEEIFNIQVAGLCQRLSATGCKCLVVGISGGLDSTLALLVAVRAFDRLRLDLKSIVGVTMPGFGTTGRTHNNAVDLMKNLGVSMREISIVKATEGHFEDIGHDPKVQDVTYENSQARERTHILMDLSNELGGMVLGTGDLSELALGWATYNGDHMSMYGVNTGVPKTLVKHLVRYVADFSSSDEIRRLLIDIVDTPISPELIPAAADGTIKQKTEDLVGPYELHDFFLYYTLRYGFSPRRIFMLACKAFEGTYDEEIIKHWLRTFFRRFFAQQFKRSCLPDGPKVGSVCLSPRGDWRMPSDASSRLWLDEVDKL